MYRSIMTVFAALVLAAGPASPIAAGPLEDGFAAYGAGDYSTALRLWRPLAEQGVAAAQNDLAAMYAEGRGVARDDAEAVRWWRKAADQGHAEAQYNLGAMYAFGRGVARDDTEAVRWWRRGADQGHADSQNNLGTMYRAGRGVPQDNVQAYRWFDLAAARYPVSSKRRRDEATENRAFVARRMTSAQIAEAQKLARDWKPK